MRIIFVRHGHPNYELDCLTPSGHKHGEAVAERLRQEPVEKTGDKLGDELDKWLAEFGYTREGDYYRVGKVRYGTGVLSAPKFGIMNDARHIANMEEKKETVYA